MPNWKLLPAYQERQEERERIEVAMREIAKYDLDTIRVAARRFYIEGWEAGSENQDVAAAKLFLLNKFIFALPRSARPDSPQARAFGGGWWGQPSSEVPGKSKASGEILLRWPWSEDDSGVWRLTGHFMGFSGEPYQALEAFDYYRKEFGKRAIPRSQPADTMGNRGSQPS